MRRGLTTAVALGILGGAWLALPWDSVALGPHATMASDRTCGKGPLRDPRPGCAPPPLPSTGNPYEDCVRRINQLRHVCQCLPPLGRWKGGEKCADKHSRHDGKNGIHRGFNDKICKPQGMAQNECPGWPSMEGVIGGCLQAMWDEGPGKRFSKHGHYINMSSREYNQVACGFSKTKSGELWSVQNFR